MIQRITEQALCTGCGACAGVCGKKAISMNHNLGGYLVAEVDEAQCVHCGKCLTVCPSYEKNQSLETIREACRGSFLKGGISYAAEKRIRREGQSGGLVTALLLYLLDSGKIDGAVVNQFCQEKQAPKAVYASTKEEIVGGAGSYYAQSAVAETALHYKNNRLAVVALGCQAKALQLAGKGSGWRPEYVIGLVCAGQNSRHMIPYLANCAQMGEKERIAKFRFRYSHPAYGGWPGNVHIVTDASRYTVDKSYRTRSKSLFEAYRCLLCYDQMCTSGDIVCGDPWGISGNHVAGETVVIARTEKGLELLLDAAQAGYIHFEELDAEKILKGQTVYPRLVHKVYSGYRACRQENWEYPYQLSPAAEKETEEVPRKEYKDYLSRMRYTRSRFLSHSAEEVEALTAACQKEQSRQQKKQKRKNTLMLPVRVFRYVKRAIKR